MQLAEPMTLATDYALALLGLWLGRRLWRLAGSDGPCRWWAAGFWTMALAAFLGGTAHGFAPMLGAGTHDLVWRATMVALGTAAVLLVQALIRTLGWSGAWTLVLGLEWLGYVAWVGWVDSDFRVAVVQYGSALVLVLAGHLVLAMRGHAGAWWVVAGVLISFGAAWIQQAGIAPHPSFNHNDLYHVVQMAGLFAFYRGVSQAAAA